MTRHHHYIMIHLKNSLLNFKFPNRFFKTKQEKKNITLRQSLKVKADILPKCPREEMLILEDLSLRIMASSRYQSSLIVQYRFSFSLSQFFNLSYMKIIIMMIICGMRRSYFNNNLQYLD